ncbi:ABC transporter permease subunit [Alishewanella longhuensis]
MLDVWEQNYIKTAKAKGLKRVQVLYRHGLRNALPPVIPTNQSTI